MSPRRSIPGCPHRAPRIVMASGLAARMAFAALMALFLPMAVVTSVTLASSPAVALELDLTDTARLKIGIGDRLSVERGKRMIPTLEALDRHGLRVDMLQIWLPRGWKKEWISPEALSRLHSRGVVPVVVHYFFGDSISQQRVESQRDAWYSSIWEMAQRIRGDEPVLVILEPEFNVAPPRGETPVTSWPWFAKELRAAVEMIRKEAPNALIGTCPGDFSGPPNLELVLGPVADDLDFIAFQEMRASTDRDAQKPGYTHVGRSALAFARYLKRAFGRPILIGYVAISSYDGWEARQAEILNDLFARRGAFRDAGVFGLIYFQLYDDPHHRGYFGPAEKDFGLITSDGKSKPALGVFRKMGRSR